MAASVSAIPGRLHAHIRSALQFRARCRAVDRAISTAAKRKALWIGRSLCVLFLLAQTIEDRASKQCSKAIGEECLEIRAA